MPVEIVVKRAGSGPDRPLSKKRAQRLLDTTVSSAANATTESGGEAEIAGGVGVRCGAATRSLRRARGAAHSAARRACALERVVKRPGSRFRKELETVTLEVGEDE
jgi:hypothetical protein